MCGARTRASGMSTPVPRKPSARRAVSGLLLQKLTDTKVLFIPYRGAGPAMTDLISGQVDLLVAQGAVTLPQIRAGAIKAIVNMSPQRSGAIPDIPTSDEAGVPGLYMSGWFGLFAPKGTPRAVIAKLNDALVEALADPKVRMRFAELGLDIAPRTQQTPSGLAAFHKAEIEKWFAACAGQYRARARRTASALSDRPALLPTHR